MLTSAEIRKLFLEYFQKKGHIVVPSSSLIPANDPTLLFTNAGMVQFKDVFTGKETKPYSKATTVQRCVRAGGKHNDLENVGYTMRHHTFFEMLGNFSFGDYFKQEAIRYAWDFLTTILQIPKERLWVTVHKNDQESADIWLKEIKIEPSHLSYRGDKDNFWSMGETGPCGYCSEIFYDHDKGMPGDPPGDNAEDNDRYVEIWNLVFMQFDRDANAKLTPLPKPSIDTGMGLERIAAVMQDVQDNYKTDIFNILSQHFDSVFGKIDAGAPAEILRAEMIAKRVVADHIRAAVFLIAEGVLPSNEGRDYVLRRIIRRAVYHLYNIGVYKRLRVCFAPFVDPLIKAMGNFYPELNLQNRKNQISEIIASEEIKFLETLERGLKILEAEIKKIKGKKIPGAIVFNLHDTYGLPDVVTEEIAHKRGLSIDRDEFEKEREKFRQLSRASSKFELPKTLDIKITGATKFLGYDTDACKSSLGKIIGMFRADGTPTDMLHTLEEGIIILDKTPFYAESGGQVGDSGWMTMEKHFDPSVYSFTVSDTKKYGQLHLHFGKVEHGPLVVGERMITRVDLKRRQAIRLNHSTAHLLHKTLQMVLGEHATQRGSSVDEKRLRFDFAHQSALKNEELKTIEKIVNEQINNDLEVKTEIKTVEEAKQEGALALFGEKYGDSVRVVKMGDFSQPFKKPPQPPFSIELCGGTHVSHTGEITYFKIISESALASGIRRIEAVTGENACRWFSEKEETLENEIDKYQKEKNTLEKELSRLKNELAVNKSKEIISTIKEKAKKAGEINIIAEKLDGIDSNTLRKIIDDLKQKLNPAVIVLASVISPEKIQLAIGISKEISKQLNANDLLQIIAKKIKGSGGGRADFAQGGGIYAPPLLSALSEVNEWVKKNQ